MYRLSCLKMSKHHYLLLKTFYNNHSTYERITERNKNMDWGNLLILCLCNFSDCSSRRLLTHYLISKCISCQMITNVIKCKLNNTAKIRKVICHKKDSFSWNMDVALQQMWIITTWMFLANNHYHMYPNITWTAPL